MPRAPNRNILPKLIDAQRNIFNALHEVERIQDIRAQHQEEGRPRSEHTPYSHVNELIATLIRAKNMIEAWERTNIDAILENEAVGIGYKETAQRIKEAASHMSTDT